MAKDTAPRGPARGTLLGDRYALLDQIGAGGMGSVYRARQVELDRDVAVKLIGDGRAATAPQVARFLTEAKTLARLSHPAIVTVFDFGRADDGTWYLVLELVRGESLGARIEREGALPWPAVLEIGRSVAEALRYAHRQRVLHRDLKPGNVMLSAATSSTVKLIDFGLARLFDASSTQDDTESAYVIGTPGYIAPEYASTGKLTPKSDHYALGVLLAEALTGAHPADRPTPPGGASWNKDEALAQHLNAACPDAPPGLLHLVRSLMSPDEHLRPEDPAAMLDAIAHDHAFLPATPAHFGAFDARPATSERPMVEVPGGVVEVGLPGGQAAKVRVPPFSVDKHLVTNGDYLPFIKATGAAAPLLWEGGQPRREEMACPVVGITYSDAEAFAHWAGRRLLTEAEWELAARGPSQFTYPWGDKFETGLCHTTYDEPIIRRRPRPIGVFSPQGDSPFGLADLMQVWEWVQAPYAAFGNLVRGGTWRDKAWPPMLSNRSWEDEPAFDVGFRTASR